MPSRLLLFPKEKVCQHLELLCKIRNFVLQKGNFMAENTGKAHHPQSFRSQQKSLLHALPPCRKASSAGKASQQRLVFFSLNSKKSHSHLLPKRQIFRVGSTWECFFLAKTIKQHNFAAGKHKT